VEALTLIGYFVIGILLEFLSTLYVRLVTGRHSLRAASISFLNTILIIGIIYNIIESISVQRNYLILIIYAAGVATGTFVGTKFNLKLKSTISTALQ